MSDTPLGILVNMSIEEFKRVLSIIAKERPDIFDILVVTEKEQQEMNEHFRGLVTQIRKDVADEPA